MRTRLFKSHFATAMLSFIICLVVIFVVVYQYFQSGYMEELKEEASYITSAVEAGGVGFLADVTDNTNMRITVISPDGTVVFDSGGDLLSAEYIPACEEVLEAFDSGEGESVSFSSQLSEKTSNYATRLSDGSVIRLSRTRESAMNLIAKMIFPIVLVLVAAIAVSVIFAVKMANKITDPINRIDLDKPDDRDVYEELRPLVRRITAQNKQIYMQMEQLKEEHKNRDLHRHEFTANVSHELKTPLTSISGFAEIIRDGLVKPEDIPRFADKIYQEAKRLITLVEDIIRLSMVEDNEIKAEKTDTDLYEICHRTINTLTPAAEKLNITLSLEGESAKVYAVPQLLDEIVYNLCDNAIKYNKRGGSVKVIVSKTDDETLLTVSDTGIGISEENLDRVFERFYRVDKSHSNEIGGTGLGLSIVKHSVAYNNASIDIKSKLGEGTSITVRFKN